MMWFPYRTKRNACFQLSFAFPFRLLFFSQVYFFFVSLIKNKFLSSFFVFYTPSWFYPILVWSMWRKNTPYSAPCYILDLYFGTIMFSVTPLILSVIPHVDSSFFPCHWSECFSSTTWRGCCSLWKCFGLCFCIVFSAVMGVRLKEQHGICTVDLATSPTLSTAQILCGLPSIKNRIMKEKYSTPEPLIFSGASQ